MINPYQQILNNRTVEEVMNVAVEAEQSQLESIVNSFRGNEVAQIGSWTFENLRTRGVHAVLDRGCLLFLYQVATGGKSNRDLFNGLIQEMGVSRTQAYREIQVWKRFAKPLLDKPDLARQFVPEALKLLAQENVPAKAREVAIEQAGRGEGIDIRLARQLLRVHRKQIGGSADSNSVIPVKPAQSNRLRRPVTQARGFIRKVIKLVRRPKKPLTPRDVDAIVRELEIAIMEIRVEAPN